MTLAELGGAIDEANKAIKAAQSGPAVTTENPIRIMTVDDHPMLREGIAGLVSTQSDMKLVVKPPTGVRLFGSSGSIVPTSP